MYFALKSFCFAFLKKKVAPAKDKIQITKPDIIGDATRMQGYAAREGLGITRIRNQRVELIPNKIKINVTQCFLAFWANIKSLFDFVIIM